MFAQNESDRMLISQWFDLWSSMGLCRYSFQMQRFTGQRRDLNWLIFGFFHFGSYFQGFSEPSRAKAWAFCLPDGMGLVGTVRKMSGYGILSNLAVMSSPRLKVLTSKRE